MNKIIARIKGGLDNEIFCYAAARRLALANNAEMVIDDVTGFACDHQHGWQYALGCLHILVRNATPPSGWSFFSAIGRALNMTGRSGHRRSRRARMPRRSLAARRGADRRGVLHAGALFQSLYQFQSVEHNRKAASDKAFTQDWTTAGPT